VFPHGLFLNLHGQAFRSARVLISVFQQIRKRRADPIAWLKKQKKKRESALFRSSPWPQFGASCDISREKSSLYLAGYNKAPNTSVHAGDLILSANAGLKFSSNYGLSKFGFHAASSLISESCGAEGRERSAVCPSSVLTIGLSTASGCTSRIIPSRPSERRTLLPGARTFSMERKDATYSR
jgi:hypothetical protein